MHRPGFNENVHILSGNRPDYCETRPDYCESRPIVQGPCNTGTQEPTIRKVMRNLWRRCASKEQLLILF